MVKQTKKTEEVGVVQELFKAVKEVDSKAVATAVKKEKDQDSLRPAIAHLVIDGAKKAGVLPRVRKSSTMRELLYNLIATDTEKSKHFHTMNKAKPTDSIKTLKGMPQARAVFSAMYPKRMAKLK